MRPLMASTLAVASLVLLALDAAAARQHSKAPLTSIESPDGDIIDCVHITKQPAFDHPLLKNHVIQMQPSDYPRSHYDESSIITYPFAQTWHQNGKCPENTIPMRRTKEEDKVKASSVRKYRNMMPIGVPSLMSVNDDPETSNVMNGHQHAIASAWGNDNYYGTQATFNLWQPTVETVKHFSLAQLWITSGTYKNNDLNSIEVGWQVFPDLYNDSNTRLFIFWTHDAYKTGCYNLCPGFIQTNNQFAIGAQLSPVSTYAGSQYDTTILVWKGQNDGNWWLKVGSYVLGYWPSSIFTNLANSASSIQWGGEVYSPNPGQTSTDMGSGHFPEEGFGKASYIRNIQVVDSSNSLVSPSDVALGAMEHNCYRVLNGTSSDWGTYIFYGGPGQNPNCP